MRLRIKMLGVAVYAVIATVAVFTGNHVIAEANAPMAGEMHAACPAGHLKG